MAFNKLSISAKIFFFLKKKQNKDQNKNASKKVERFAINLDFLPDCFRRFIVINVTAKLLIGKPYRQHRYLQLVRFKKKERKKKRFKPTDANDTNQLIWKFSYGRWQRLTFSDVPVFHFHPITQLLHSLSPSLCLILCLFVNVNAIKSISLSLNQYENQHRSFGILRIYFTRLKWMAYTTIYLKAYWQFVHMVWKSKAA